MKYVIIRFYKDDSKENKIIKRGLTLQEAQAHCQDPKTSGDGWFDGYGQENDYGNLTDLDDTSVSDNSRSYGEDKECEECCHIVDDFHVDIDDDIVCDDCVTETHFFCVECDELCKMDDATDNNDEGFWCIGCFQDQSRWGAIYDLIDGPGQGYEWDEITNEDREEIIYNYKDEIEFLSRKLGWAFFKEVHALKENFTTKDGPGGSCGYIMDTGSVQASAERLVNNIGNCLQFINNQKGVK